jgi:hypothetical protein
MSSQPNRPTQRIRLKVVLIPPLIFLIVAVTAMYFGGAFDQRINMRRARAHFEVVRAALANHPESGKVDVFAYTGCGGALGVHARIDSEKVYQQLKQTINGTHPPVRVAYLVVRPDGQVYEQPCQ